MPPDPVDETPIPEELDCVFPSLILESDRVCCHCFSRLARRERFPDEPGYRYADVLSFVEENLPPGARWEILDREYYERVQLCDRTEQAFHPASPASRGGSTACRECGSTTPLRRPPTRSKSEAVSAAASLSTTLEEYGVRHDWVTLLSRVRTLKSDPEFAGNDKRTFSRAVADSIVATLDTPSPTTSTTTRPSPDHNHDPNHNSTSR